MLVSAHSGVCMIVDIRMEYIGLPTWVSAIEYCV
jgi:hypothetical protein